MSGYKIDIDDADTKARLARIAAAGGNLRPPLTDIGDTLKFSTQRRFETQTAPDGSAWAPLSRRTLKRRGAGAKILRDTARLYQSITRQVTDTSVEVGTNVQYAAAHQLGAVIVQHPHSRVMRFRATRLVRGARGRFTGETKDPNEGAPGMLFASRRHKKVTEKRVTFGERRIRIPARPFLGLSPQDRADITEILVDHLAQAGASSGSAP